MGDCICEAGLRVNLWLKHHGTAQKCVMPVVQTYPTRVRERHCVVLVELVTAGG